MTSRNLKTAIGLILAASLAVGGAALAKGPGGGGKPPGGESATNNLSFPVIFSDGVVSPGYLEVLRDMEPITGDVTSAAICAQEDNTVVPVPTNILCYYGRKNLGISEETGERIWVGEPKVWWLQERIQNRWQAYDPIHTGPEAVAVTAVDWGDLLESGSLTVRKIRTELTMFKDAATDTLFSSKVATISGGTCDATTDPSGCFAAYEMGGAVPGTDQSINEIQGTDFGPGTGAWPGTGVVVDPVGVKGYHATVYSSCARLLIQLVTVPGLLTWSSIEGHWIGGAAAPVINISTYAGTYGAEVNAGGSMIYGYNWDAMNIAAGKYRLTFVLDGEGRCPVPLKMMFDANTQIINTGEVAPGVVLSQAALQIAGGNGTEGGLAYVDITLKTKGGGKPRSTP